MVVMMMIIKMIMIIIMSVRLRLAGIEIVIERERVREWLNYKNNNPICSYRFIKKDEPEWTSFAQSREGTKARVSGHMNWIWNGQIEINRDQFNLIARDCWPLWKADTLDQTQRETRTN